MVFKSSCHGVSFVPCCHMKLEMILSDKTPDMTFCDSIVPNPGKGDSHGLEFRDTLLSHFTFKIRMASRSLW